VAKVVEEAVKRIELMDTGIKMVAESITALTRPIEWEFDVSRDYNGFIDKVTATATKFR